MTRARRGMLTTVIATFAVILVACSGLPVRGEVRPGLALDEADVLPDISQIASDPMVGASAEEMVEGFLDAALTPTNSWEIARKFLSPEFAAIWKPSVNVTIDASAATREFADDLPEDDDESVEGQVRVTIDQIATLDSSGVYTEVAGDAAVAVFELARNEDGEWRITSAANGIVLDADAFTQVYRRHALQYFDQSWSHLIPDVRWFPRRAQIATTLTQELLEGSPSAWLEPAVRSAYPSDVTLARDAVPINAEKVATVELTAPAQTLGSTELARMRTQLEATLRSAGVLEVRLLVNGRDLEAGRTALAPTAVDTGPVVLTDDSFGGYVGDEITPYEGITAAVVELASSVVAVDVSDDGARAAVQLDTRGVYTVADGRVDQLDARPGLIAPSMDPYGYTWTVPASSPAALIAWRPDVTEAPIANAFPGTSSISHLRVSSDGVRLVAVVTVGGQRWAAASAILREADNTPIGLGPVQLIAQLDDVTDVLAVSWVGEDRLSVLTSMDGRRSVLTQDIGGPGAYAGAPSDAVMLSGGAKTSAVRILAADGVLFAQRGTTWQMGLVGVRVLGTHAGQ